ncbi:GNAT family N-acetyltransferase [Paracraurococcus ruber]|uniref:GNAT family N-acetyltransferase n=1 Tax=Paracraurococcus ruber TaxID=77675 RepID=A0ABS1CYX8_9PROT|nr:GNAT family N-acetyltransferase [Paracraurococcus ruber]MBK1659521.1 GNAT family N-acetyltransferase [Paracraurococcus ruber]TDG33042.1 GNAT family N-acetyltransferase [Paracraurococcus ruber]
MGRLVETIIPVAVDVTFLRMDRRPAEPGPALPPDASVARVGRCSVGFYRYLYHTVGQDYVWWLRRTLPDAELAAILGDRGVSIHVLYRDGEPAGFYELDRRNRPHINLSYFGLLPHAIGQGLGRAFLRHAIDAAWAELPRGLTVNTCTADHPRALPNYMAAGFAWLRTVREVWQVPARLGLPIPDRLRQR